MKVQMSPHLLKMIKIIAVAAVLFVLIAISGIIMLSRSPSIGAYGADFLRQIIGDQPVAVMETALFQMEDTVKKAEFNLGLVKPDNPFGPAPTLVAVEPTPTGSAFSAQTAQEYSPLPQKDGRPSTQQPPTTTGLKDLPNSGSSSTPTMPSLAAPANNAGSNEAWMPPPISLQDNRPGSGVWQPYMTDSSGRVVAYRAFVLPDPTRPYAVVGIVAFDLQHIRLHYVIGFSNPYAPGVKKTAKGAISPSDLQPGVLLATFNGGFKYEHGHFGSMADGLVSAPSVAGLGTLAIYQNGQIQMGEWGKDIQPSADLAAYRQNGPLVIQNGAISSKVNDSLVWGRTIAGGTVTWRSGAALSADNRTFYYFAGPSLSIYSLAGAMETVHPQSAIQLDINTYWVHFTAIRVVNGQLKTEALFPRSMSESRDRYLSPYPRDFFYITSAHSAP